jgi:hypothetical protein
MHYMKTECHSSQFKMTWPKITLQPFVSAKRKNAIAQCKAHLSSVQTSNKPQNMIFFPRNKQANQIRYCI